MVNRFFTTLALLLSFSTSFSQWTRVQQLPSANIASIYHKDNILYAGGENIIYISKDKGITWDSTSAIPGLFLVTSIIVYKNEIYAAAPHRHVAKSSDSGITWQNIVTVNDTLDVSDFCEFKGDLYASTLGNSVYKLDPVSQNKWFHFNNGLGTISLNANAIAGTSSTLIAGATANGLYDYLAPNSTTWEERFLLEQISPNEGVFDIITVHDTLFLTGTTGMYYMSTNNGQNWNLFGNRLKTANTTIVNAKQALISSIRFFAGGSFFTVFLYIKKDSLQDPFVDFSIVPNHFTWKIDILGDKLWDASDEGLFFMPLSLLPGISAADDSLNIILPVNFTSFNTKCEGSKTLLSWKTAQEQNSSHFNIERSANGIIWTVIGSLPAAKNSAVERSYSFTGNNPLQNNYYRIVEYDLDEKPQYTDVLRSSCNATDIITLLPNPVHDIAFINFTTGKESQVIIKVLDAKSALMQIKKVTAMKGSNRFSIDASSLASGIYSLSISWNNGQMNKVIQLLKN